MPAKRIIDVGYRYGNLTAIATAGTNGNRRRLFVWRCVCGNEITHPLRTLQVGNRIDCGCATRTQDIALTTYTMVKETEARTLVLFHIIHNLQVEIQQMVAAITKTNALLLELFERPQTHADAERIIKDFIFTKAKKDK